jgi:5-methylphenazine-1-carboxylate 1-monooxygenase
MKVAIAGGGIGGMALALSLVEAGLEDVDVYESTAAIRELGVGITLLPHGVRELTELGLLDDLYAVGIPTAELAYYSTRGQKIWSEPRGIAAGYHWPQFSIHRGELLGVLYRRVVERLGPKRVHTSHHLTRFGQRQSEGVWAEFVDRARNATISRVEADVLVGCDGIHSNVRRAFFPDEGAPRWNGVVMWRGVTLGHPFLSRRTMINAGTSRQRLVAYPMSTVEELQGRALVNWNATVQTSVGDTMPPQDWTFLAQRDEVLSTFESFDFDFLDVPALIRGADVVYQYPMTDRDPLPSCQFGRVTLLGDAAHPMRPIGGNGASQAIIDARVLARELALQPAIEMAIAAYDAQRRPATAAVVQSNRAAGASRCQDLVEERAPNGFGELSDVVSQQELEDIALDYKRTAGFDVDALNSRPSLSLGVAPR